MRTTVTTKSGLTGERAKLRDNYADFEEFSAYSRTFGIATRLGYKSAASAWRSNPTIEYSVNPADLRRC